MIVKSAIRKDGKIYTGFRHSDIFKNTLPLGCLSDGEQGFITDKGEFVNRAEAYIIAKECNQIIRDLNTNDGLLYSEHLWVGKEIKENTMVDNINHPPHYSSGKIECIEALEAATQNLSGIEAVCTANAIKYLWRWKSKNGNEDLKKAQWYIDRLIKTVEGGSKDVQQL